jgi:two-component system, chemotaxis family, protein-glutamate methylesterase/glutaminase
VDRVPDRDIIVIGGSAGAIRPLRTILQSLPPELPAAIFVVIHVNREAPAEPLLSTINSGPLPAMLARDGLPIEHGRVYIAPPDHHVLLGPDTMRVVRGPHENRVRPSIDPTLRTAANVFDGRVIAVILSGGLNDGTYGAMVVNSRSGTVLVQDPEECEDPSMPRSALTHAKVDFIEKASAIGDRLNALVRERQHEKVAPFQTPRDPGQDELETVSSHRVLPPGDLSPMICPECRGPLWLKQNGTLSHFRCHVGHAYSGEVLASHQNEELEAALWSAVRVLDEHAALLRRLGQTTPVGNFEERAVETERKAKLIRNTLLTGPPN